MIPEKPTPTDGRRKTTGPSGMSATVSSRGRPGCRERRVRPFLRPEANEKEQPVTPAVGAAAGQALRQYQAVERRDSVLSDALRGATITARSLGFSLGSLGISYESADVSLQSAPDPGPARARRAFQGAMEADGLYEALLVQGGITETTPGGRAGPPLRRQGLAAYAAQASGGTSAGVSMLNVVV